MTEFEPASIEFEPTTTEFDPVATGTFPIYWNTLTFDKTIIGKTLQNHLQSLKTQENRNNKPRASKVYSTVICGKRM